MRWLIDEMLPPAIATPLNETGHDALSIVDVALDETDDATIYAAAVAQQRVMVTDNVADFSVVVTQRLGREEPCVPLLLVRKQDYPRGKALAPHLARRLDAWATENPNPYPGPNWA